MAHGDEPITILAAALRGAPGAVVGRPDGTLRGAWRWALRCASVGLATLVLLVLGATAGAAHARLETSEPRSGERLSEAPTEVRLRFDEPVDVGLGGVSLTDAEGRALPMPGPARADGRTVTAPVPPLTDGVYVVVWRVTSADGHAVRGAFTFRVGEGTGTVDDDVLAGLLDGGGSAATTWLAGLVRLVGTAALAAGLGGAVFLVCWWPAGASERWARRLVVGGTVTALVVTVLGIGIVGADTAGQGPSTALDPATWRAVLSTRSGAWWGWRAAALGVSTAVVVLVVRRLASGAAPSAALRLAVALPGMAVLTSVALAGHAATGRWVAAGVAADLVHLAAMTVWLGGLALLVVALTRAPDAELAGVLARFSTAAAACVALLVASGAAQSWRQVGSLDALTGTTYGRVLIAKLVAVGALLGVAAVTRRLAHGAATPTRRRFRRVVGVEVGAAVVVLALTAALVQTVPARDALETPFSTTVVQGDRVLGVGLEPGRTGTNDLHLVLSTTSGALGAPTEATARVRFPERDVPATPVLLELVTPGHWVGRGVELPFPGTWQLEVLVQVAPGQQVRFAAPVTVR